MSTINADQQWKWRLEKNEYDKTMAKILIICIASDGSNGTYPGMLLLILLLLYFLWCWCVDFLKRSAKQKWNWGLAFNNCNIRTGGTIIVNTSAKALIDTYIMLLMLLLPSVIFFVLLLCWLFENLCNKKFNWRLVENEQNIRPAEALIINAPSENLKAITLWCFYCCCYIFVLFLKRVF